MSRPLDFLFVAVAIAIAVSIAEGFARLPFHAEPAAVAEERPTT
jgi:hypothetical protein